MVKSKEAPVCPYCRTENSKFSVLGTSGLVNYSGMIGIQTECRHCKKLFNTDIEISITYKTKKS